jgi:hypothetical protein
MATKFRFRFAPQVIVSPLPATGKQRMIPPVSMIEVQSCDGLETPQDAKLWMFHGAPVELPKSPLTESDWDSWWSEFQKTHRFAIEGTKNISHSPGWQWVQIAEAQ